VNEGWFWSGQGAARLFTARHAGFLTDLDLFTPDEKYLDPAVRDYYLAHGVEWAALTAIPIPTGENVVLVVSRLAERGPIERAVIQELDELRPHLARSAFMSARL
jgi:hypothetical protein